MACTSRMFDDRIRSLRLFSTGCSAQCSASLQLFFCIIQILCFVHQMCDQFATIFMLERCDAMQLMWWNDKWRETVRWNLIPSQKSVTEWHSSRRRNGCHPEIEVLISSWLLHLTSLELVTESFYRRFELTFGAAKGREEDILKFCVLLRLAIEGN